MKKILFLIVLIGAIQAVSLAKEPPDTPKPKPTKKSAGYRADCSPGNSQVDLDVNNVRARLLSRGDFWWDYNDPKYIVPNVDPASGLDEISSIFSGAVWMGGFDPAGNLKIAVADYATDGSDYYPGPLNGSGETDAPICTKWDRHFSINGAGISQFKAKFKLNGSVEESDVPDDFKSYPAKGNPYFAQTVGFALPDQDLAPFHDENEDGLFNPLDGDYPVIEIRGCPMENFADQMFFQIYNDNGGPHQTSNGIPIRMEVQVQAFAFATNDELNDMTFMRYKLINKAIDTITQTYFAMWVDADLGCDNDDYIGCDTTRSLAFYYNADDTDGESDCSCQSGAKTYCHKIPLLGIDYFRGPLDEFGDELGMSSFTYINRAGTTPAPPPGTTDPGSAAQYYNYLTGRWRDGSPYFGSGDGYQDPGNPIRYAFPGRPNDPNGWSMAQEGLPPGDRRTVQASGPFTLAPGKTNELIIGLPWVANVDHPAPDITKLLAADDKAQNLFDACFKITDGPDAPDMYIVELDREIVITLHNNEILSNNKFESYQEEDLAHADQFYKFEGYQIFQTVSPNVSLVDLNDPDKARLVGEADVKNGVTKLYNWSIIANDPTTNQPIYGPKLMVEGKDEGVKRSFHFTRDAFGTGAARLINHRKYYYVAIAYAYNNFEPFDPTTAQGQNMTYLAGRKTPYGGKILPVTVIPRPSTYDLLASDYGDGLVITRVSGGGNGGNFLKISKEQREQALSMPGGGKVTYLPGQSPFRVKVVNPLKVKDGKFRFYISDGTDGNPPHAIKDAVLNWVLEVLDGNGNVIETVTSDNDLSYFNEQIIYDYGISIEIGQVGEAGEHYDDTWGAIGMEVKYEDLDKPIWLISAKDDTGIGGSPLAQGNINFVLNNDHNPQKVFTENVDNNVAFYPWFLINTSRSDDNVSYFFTPGWFDNKASVVKRMDSLYHLNNVDIVLTSDKSKWSRCVVLEAASSLYGNAEVSIPQIKPIGNAKQYTLRKSPSVGKDVGADGNPAPDGDGDGMGWFPGYAVDVESGKRLNIFFAENSTFRDDPNFYTDGIFGEAGPTGADMMFNPSSTQLINMGFIQGGNPLNPEPNVNSMFMGGQHFVFVTYDEYDECAWFRQQFSQNNSIKRAKALARVQWVGLPLTAPGEKLLSYADGLIPNDVVISLRAANPYNTVVKYEPISATNEIVEYGPLPTYEFELNGAEAKPIAAASESEVNEALDAISVAPNPYYGYAYYERDQFTTIVKITNLPAKCTVTIYSLDGKFIKQFKRDEEPYVDSQTGGERQIAPDVEWDLKNASGIPIASGVYLIHVKAPGLGERVIKWFGMNRQFDPSGL